MLRSPNKLRPFKVPHPVTPVTLWNMGYPSELSVLNSNLVKSRLRITYFSDIQSIQNFVQSTSVLLLCSVQKCQYDWTIETDFMDKRDFARLEFKMSFGYPIAIELNACQKQMIPLWGKLRGTTTADCQSIIVLYVVWEADVISINVSVSGL